MSAGKDSTKPQGKSSASEKDDIKPRGEDRSVAEGGRCRGFRVAGVFKNFKGFEISEKFWKVFKVCF